MSPWHSSTPSATHANLLGRRRGQPATTPLAQSHPLAIADVTSHQSKMASHNNKLKNQHSTLRIWQWNCRSYRPRHTSLQEFIKSNQPHIIALQETNTQDVRLQGYMACAQTQRTAILVKKTLSVQKHEVEHTQTEHTLIELLPERKTQKSLFIANVYSPLETNYQISITSYEKSGSARMATRSS